MSDLRSSPDFDFQLDIARSWYKRGQTSNDVFAKFFFYFAAFNALYFLHGRADGVGEGKEKKLVTNLLTKLSPEAWETIVSNHCQEIGFFRNRIIPRMYRSRGRDPWREGHEQVSKLGNPESSPSEKLEAMGQILYIVRCNLSHGRKIDRGDDEAVIKAAVPLLCALCDAAIKYTEDAV